MTARQPIPNPPRWLRQRQRTDGSWRIWWEPNAKARQGGFAPVELDPKRLTWSVREATRLNGDVDSVGSKGARQVSGGRTVDALIAQYQASSRFTKKSAATRKGYSADMKLIAEKWGSRAIGEFTRPVIYTWYETLAASRGQTYAVNIIRAFSVLFTYAELLGWRSENSNPCFRLGMTPTEPRHRSASWDEFDALVRTADDLGMPAMACAIVLAVLQAPRQNDIIHARLDAFRPVTMALPGEDAARDVWIWEMIRSKKKNYGVMPLHDEVLPRVQAMQDRAIDDQIYLLHDDATGLPYSGDLFRKRWATIRATAASRMPKLKTLQFRDLRRTFGVMSRAGGADRADVGDVLGNSAAINPQLGETYMPPSFHTAARAVGSIQRPVAKKGKQA
ncbi:MAG: hypothetical protein ACKVKF_11690 [Rhodobacterales bacterium]